MKHVSPTVVVAVLALAASPAHAQHDEAAVTTYLPTAENSKIVTVATTGQPAARVIVQTQAVAIKENGPKETVATFGEVYAFAPSTMSPTSSRVGRRLGATCKPESFVTFSLPALFAYPFPEPRYK